jgi:hypothetical protein
MTDKYPKEAQNPPTKPGERPEEQPPPRQRVPDDKPDVDEMTTDERRVHDPERLDHLPPKKE